MDFWTRLEDLIASHTLVIDRPKGSTHPRYPDMVYPLNYGYLKFTSGGDGNEIDAWHGSIEDGLLAAIICAIDMKKEDTEIKLLIGCTDTEVGIIEKFYNDNSYMSGIVIRKPGHVPDNNG
jgi:inorganic pyrophosphatase